MTAITRPAPLRPAAFTARWDALLSEVLVRFGFLGSHAYGSWRLDNGLAKKLRARITDPTMTTNGSMDLSTAQCPLCDSLLTVINSRDIEHYIWGGTFGEDTPAEHAAGDLVCSADAAHQLHDEREAPVVHLESTLAAAVAMVDLIADEWGW